MPPPPPLLPPNPPTPPPQPPPPPPPPASQLKPADVEAVNGLRAALSATMGAQPRDKGETAPQLQMRLMRLVSELSDRPPLSPSQAAAAARAAAEPESVPPPPPPTPAHAADFLPPLTIAGHLASLSRPDAPGSAAASVDAADAEADADAGAAEGAVDEGGGGEGGESSLLFGDSDDDLELLDG